ncbi:MAG: hypothetical protein H8D67_18775 [Deltaproteobacteria bacterium]|nr:hypothetical protein [Deltaproteobacteria bacterium]
MVVLANEEHIVSKLRERVSDEIANVWLYKLLKKINNYIPNDWRLGARSNDFIIRVIGEHEATFVGDSVQTSEEPEHIYHIIKTVLWPGGLAKGEVPPAKCPECGQEIKEEVPRPKIAARPNLYVLEDFPDEGWFFNLSPLAARQYEKINPHDFQPEKVNPAEHYEYHRVHPLYKFHPIYKGHGGIQKEVFSWIKWYYNGKIEWRKVSPEDDWRGKSFWATAREAITKEEQNDIMWRYTQGLRKYT